MNNIILQPTGGEDEKDFQRENYIQWAEKDIPRYRKIWEDSVGDTVLLINKGKIFAIAKIEELVIFDGDYPLGYYWNDNIQYTDIPLSKFNEIVGYKSNFTPRSFMAIKKDNLKESFEFLNIKQSEENVKSNTEIYPEIKKPKITELEKEVVDRNSEYKNIAIKNANFKCELDESHITFIKDDKTQYMEGHHLIPISQYDSFEHSVDVVANIVSLCPTCHRMLHFGNKQNRDIALEKLFNKKIDGFKKVGLDITLENLKKLY